MRNIYIITCLIALSNCSQKMQTISSQGISGETLWVSGNHMPSPNSPPPASELIKREVLIYELTTLNQVSGYAPIYSAINSKLVKKVMTDDKGKFTVNLPVGTYSVFTKEDQGYFAATFEKRNINPVTIKKDSLSHIVIHINYTATY